MIILRVVRSIDGLDLSNASPHLTLCIAEGRPPIGAGDPFGPRAGYGDVT